MRVTAIVALLLVATSAVSAQDIGDRLLRTYFVFAANPLTTTDAINAGWGNFSTAYADASECDPVVGFIYALGDSGAPTKGNQVILSYTAAGQLNGWGIRMWGNPSSQLINGSFWRDTGAGDGSYDIILTTRDPSLVCSGESGAELIGDRLSIWDIFSIPLDAPSAVDAGWVPGDCIGKMGVHHAYDLNAPGSQTWNWLSLVPIQPMYGVTSQKLTAVLVNMPDLQVVEPFGDCEGPFPNFLFCKNWCANTGCTFSGVTVWSTIHFFLGDPNLVTCAGAPCSV
jgi:hypothetical protein